MHNSLKLAAVLVAVSATAASAQGNGRNVDGVPPGMRPPAGMCRVWINGVPPGQQPGVTDCATAQTQVRANSRVIYGSNTRATRTYTTRRQLANGSWVLDRFRRDANGNVTLLSTRPIGVNGVTKAERKADKRELKAQRKSDKREMKKNDREDDRNEVRGAKHENKGKGKHEKGERDDDDNDNG